MIKKTSMKKKVLLSCFWLIMLMLKYRCTVNTKKNPESYLIKLNAIENTNLKFDYVSSVIRLEANSESMMGSISKAYVDFSNDRVFVLSNFNIYTFDINGEFQNKLKVGKGPGEISRIYSFTIDSVNRTLYAIDEGRRLCLYDYNGNIINDYDIKEFASIDVYVLDEDNVLLCRSFVGGQEKHFVGLYNLSKKAIIKKFISSEFSSYPKTTMVTASNFSCNNDKVYFYSPNIFGLFEYSNSEFDQILNIDLGNKAVSASISNKFKDKNHYKLRKEAKSQHYIPFIMSAFMFKEHYFIVLDDDNSNCLAMNKGSQAVFKKGPLCSYFDLPDKQSFRSVVGLQDDLLIFGCNPVEFLEADVEEREVEIGGNNLMINTNDNPFLVLIK